MNSLSHVISSFSGSKLSHLSVKGAGLDQDGQAYGIHVLTALSLVFETLLIDLSPVSLRILPGSHYQLIRDGS